MPSSVTSRDEPSFVALKRDPMSGLFRGKTAFITGASSGIGAALALAFAQEGARVALAARREDRLEQLAATIRSKGGEAVSMVCDVTERASLDRSVAKTVDAFGGIDVVVANAGFGVHGAGTRLETEDYRRQFSVNVFGVIDTVYATLAELRKSKGRLALVSSICGRIGMPVTVAYCASKFAVSGFGESLYYDLAEEGVSVTLIHPGLVESEFWTIDNQGEQTITQQTAPSFLVMPVEKAARQMVRAIHQRKPDLVVTKHGKAMVFLRRHFPRTVRWTMRVLTKGRLEAFEKTKRGKLPGFRSW